MFWWFCSGDDCSVVVWWSDTCSPSHSTVVDATLPAICCYVCSTCYSLLLFVVLLVCSAYLLLLGVTSDLFLCCLTTLFWKCAAGDFAFWCILVWLRWYCYRILFVLPTLHSHCLQYTGNCLLSCSGDFMIDSGVLGRCWHSKHSNPYVCYPRLFVCWWNRIVCIYLLWKLRFVSVHFLPWWWLQNVFVIVMLPFGYPCSWLPLPLLMLLLLHLCNAVDQPLPKLMLMYVTVCCCSNVVVVCIQFVIGNPCSLWCCPRYLTHYIEQCGPSGDLLLCSGGGNSVVLTIVQWYTCWSCSLMILFVGRKLLFVTDDVYLFWYICYGVLIIPGILLNLSRCSLPFCYLFLLPLPRCRLVKVHYLCPINSFWFDDDDVTLLLNCSTLR